MCKSSTLDGCLASSCLSNTMKNGITRANVHVYLTNNMGYFIIFPLIHSHLVLQFESISKTIMGHFVMCTCVVVFTWVDQSWNASCIAHLFSDFS